MMTTHIPDGAARPAPLPYATPAARGEVPAPTPVPPANRLPEDPGAPLMREDEFTLWLCISIVVAFVLLMVAVSATGGL